MKFRIFSLLALAALALAAFVPAGPAELEPGAPAPAFNLKNVNGKMVSFESFPQAKGFIVVFTCNHCPFSVKYEDAIIALDKKYAPQGYPVIAINPNDARRVPEDSYANMKKRAREKGFTFPYLLDDTQQTAHAYGATKTPHVFVVQRDAQGKHFVRYVGAINNNSDNPAQADQHFVAQAVDQLLAGQPVQTAQTRAVGCGIKWREN